jgi:hypothetical protein
MPAVYFAAAAVGVLVATAIAAFIKTADIRKQMRQQLILQIESVQEQPSHDQEPAAMVSVG